jgi:hypothetical protein
MKHVIAAVLLAGLVAVSCSRPTLGKPGTPAPAAYLGFDRNDYPGDDNMKLLRRTFSFTGYWLNNPPGATSNTWTGKRHTVEAMGFGFLVVFNGRTYKEIMASGDATKLGEADGSWQPSRRSTKAFRQGRSSSSTRRKADACWQNSGRTFMPGRTPCRPRGSVQACTVPGFPSKRAQGRQSSLPKTYERTQAEGSWHIG